MTGRVGGEIDELGRLAEQFQRERGEVERLTQGLSGAVGNVWWIGRAADNFKNNQWPGYERMLKDLAHDLDVARQEVANRRDLLVHADEASTAG